MPVDPLIFFLCAEEEGWTDFVDTKKCLMNSLRKKLEAAPESKRKQQLEEMEKEHDLDEEDIEELKKYIPWYFLDD